MNKVQCQGIASFLQLVNPRPRKYLRLRCVFLRVKTKISLCHTRPKGPQRRAISILFPAIVCEATMRASRSCLYMRRPCPILNFTPQWHRRRPYSIQSQEEAIAQLPDINPGALSITRTTTPKQVLPPEELVFGRTFTGKHATAFPESKPHTVLRQLNI